MSLKSDCPLLVSVGDGEKSGRVDDERLLSSGTLHDDSEVGSLHWSWAHQPAFEQTPEVDGTVPALISSTALS